MEGSILKKYFRAIFFILLCASVIQQTSILCLATEKKELPSWVSEALTYCEEQELIETDYEWEGMITRGDAITILYRLQKYPLEIEVGDLNPFQDIDKNSPYYSEVLSLYYSGIYSGVKDEAGRLFAKVEDEMTRADALTLLVRGLRLNSLNQYSYLIFEDSNEVPDYACASISTLVDLDILHGYEDGKLRPKETMTRLEYLSLVHRISTEIHTTKLMPKRTEYLRSTFESSMSKSEFDMQLFYDNKTNELTRRIFNEGEYLYSVPEDSIQLEYYHNNVWNIIPIKSAASDLMLYGLYSGSEITLSFNLDEYDFNFPAGRYRLIQMIQKKTYIDAASLEAPFYAPKKSPYEYVICEFELLK